MRARSAIPAPALRARPRSAVRRLAPGAAALALSCAALAGCSASGGSSPGPASTAASSPSAGSSPANTGKLTGNFCTDLKNIEKNVPIPATASGNIPALEQRASRYFNELAAYYGRLAAEAPPQVGQDVNRVVSAFRQFALALPRGSHSVKQVERQLRSSTGSGAAATKAFKQLMLYMTTKCE
jgi:hypothetical protein